jgi:thioredoxin 1
MSPLEVIRFTAPWCAPCKMIAKFFVAFEEEFPDIVFHTVNMSEDIPTQFTLKSPITLVPSVVVIRDNVEAGRYVGTANKNAYATFIQSHLGLA